MRRLLLASSILTAACGYARADHVDNPGMHPSATLVIGNCVQATSQFTVATTNTPCGSGAGTGNVSGPASTTIGNVVIWGNGTGTGVENSTVPLANIPQLGAINIFGAPNTFSNGQVGATSIAAATYKTGGTVPTGQLAIFPQLTVGAFNARSGASDAGIIIGNAQDAGQCGYFGAWSTTAGGIRICPEGISLYGPVNFDTIATGVTPPAGDSSTDVATTAYVQGVAASYLTIQAAQQTYATISGVQSAYMPFTGGTFTGPVTFGASQAISVVGTGPFTGTHYLTNSVLRWNVGVDGAESGVGNTGSDFHIYGYNDAGVFQGAAMTVTRSNLTASFLNRPTWAGALVPWDSGNLDPTTFATPASITTALVPYLKSADAASIYLTQANAAATYTTPAEVNAALSTFLTIANAASTYLTQAAAANTYATISGVQSAYLRITDAASTYLTIANAASTYLTQTNAAATYFAKAGGTITGATQFNVIPVLNASLPPLTDSSGDVTSSAWVQALITNRVGNGPFIPLTGVGMPYDISFPYIGPGTPQTPYPSAYNVLTYVFARKVTFPINFGAPQVTCQSVPTNTTVLPVSRTGSVAGIIGSLTFTHANCKSQFSILSAQTFLPGDTLSIFTNESAANPAIADPTLGGIGGTIPGTISQ